MGVILENRRSRTAERVETLKADLQISKGLAEGKACVYATGSFARGEASAYSDLDLFIVGKSRKVEETNRTGKHPRSERVLRRLDEICLKAELIDVTKRLSIPEFSGDGEYLKHYTVDELTGTLGRPEDDVTNTFTARLLLLLESKPLIGGDVYREAVSDVVAAYWGDFVDHSQNFMPAFLANDILRIWRTLCVNYEARTEKDPPEQKAKRKLKNYKLKHSRLLTCYSALLYLLESYALNGTVSADAAITMTQLSPTERIEWLGRTAANCKSLCNDLIELYEVFLEQTAASEDALKERFLNPDESKQLFSQASAFGDKVFELLQCVGQDGHRRNRFYRLLVV